MPAIPSCEIILHRVDDLRLTIGLYRVDQPMCNPLNLRAQRIDAFDVEMGNSSSELVDYFLKRSQMRVGARK